MDDCFWQSYFSKNVVYSQCLTIDVPDDLDYDPGDVNQLEIYRKLFLLLIGLQIMDL